MKFTGVFLAVVLTAVVCFSDNVLGYSGGDGTMGNPYQIANVTDFQQLSTATSDDLQKAFILTADINLSGLTFTQAPVAPYTGPNSGFYGTFDGNGHKISNLTINASTQDYIGLFGYVNYGQISNLGIEDVNIVGHHDVGGLVGRMTSMPEYLARISNCYVSGSVSGTGSSVGGLVGWVEVGRLTSCYASGSVSGNADVGGLVGEVGGNGTVTSCYATGLVSGLYVVGGLAGLNMNNGTFTGCFWDTQTSGKTVGVGDGDGTSTGVTGKTTAEMQALSTFTSADWDFSTTWRMPANDYPRLAWETRSLLQVGNWPASLTVEKGGTLAFTFDLSRQAAGSAVSWTVSADAACPWVSSITPSSGSSVSPADITNIAVTIATGSLDVGTYTTVLLLSDGNVTLKKAVSIKVFRHVDMRELAILGSFWGMTGCDTTQPCSAADWFTDGNIDVLDLRQLCLSWLTDEMVYDSPTPPEITEGFESDTFSALPWAMTGDMNWATISTGAFEGTYSAKSGVIIDNQSSTLEVAINTGDCNTISFARKVSSESGYDYLRFYVDGVEKNKWSGTVDWGIVTFVFTPGQHTFEWSYTKDDSVSSGSDCAWIDTVRIY